MANDDSSPLTRDIAPFGVRMPPDLKDRVALAAKGNNRSMNAEIVATLEEKYPAPKFDNLRAAHQIVISVMRKVMMTPDIPVEQRQAIADGIEYANELYENILSAQSDEEVRAGLVRYGQIINDLGAAADVGAP